MSLLCISQLQVNNNNGKMSSKMLCDSQLYDYMWFDFKTMFDQVAKTLHT
jgi:hypothetical protein